MGKEDLSLTLGTIYQMNQDALAKEKPLPEPALGKLMTDVQEYIQENKDSNYFMLLCHERRDYTVFKREGNNMSFAVKELREVLQERGGIIAGGRTEDEIAMELWCATGTEAFCFYFFPIDKAVISF